MTKQEYEKIQYELDQPINDEHKRRYDGGSKYWDEYKKAVLKCKSVLHSHKPKEE